MVEVFKEQSNARAEYSTAVFVMIEQLQMGVSTIATALVLLCRASTVATFVGKMGVASGDIGTRKAIYS